eukprot:m.23931 g.23931  ORF g.23931 m.23931 type:complete len:175 (-) comp9050_c0_seq1:103-627(-)
MSFVFVDPSTSNVMANQMGTSSQKNSTISRKATAMRGLKIRQQNIQQSPAPTKGVKKMKGGLGGAKLSSKLQMKKNVLTKQGGTSKTKLTVKSMTSTQHHKLKKQKEVQEVEHMGFNDDDFMFKTDLDDELDILFETPSTRQQKAKKKPVDLSEFDLQVFDDDDETDEYGHLFD